MLKGFDPGDGALALFLRPHPRHLDSFCVPTPGNSPFFFLNANAQGLAGGGWGGGGTLLELTDTLTLF